MYQFEEFLSEIILHAIGMLERKLNSGVSIQQEIHFIMETSVKAVVLPRTFDEILHRSAGSEILRLINKNLIKQKFGFYSQSIHR